MNLDLQCTGFEFECYTRDKMVADDERKLKRFLEEQKRDQELNKAYEVDYYRPPEDKSKEMKEKAMIEETWRREKQQKLLESSYSDYRQRKDYESSLKKKDEYELLMKFEQDLK